MEFYILIIDLSPKTEHDLGDKSILGRCAIVHSSLNEITAAPSTP